MRRLPVIGLVGGIGSGKSTVARLLAEAGAAVIDSDELNHQQLATPEVIDTLVSWWGETILQWDSGAVPAQHKGVKLDRDRVAEIIFNDPAQRQRLEGLVHPRIAAQRQRLMEAYCRDERVRAIVLDSPLLLEAGLDQDCDAIVFVEADDRLRQERALNKHGWTEAQWRQREKAQLPLDIKRKRADYIVVNKSSDIAQLRQAVQHMFQELPESSRLDE